MRGWTFPYINEPRGTHGLPAVILAEVLGHSPGTREYRLAGAQLAEAIGRLQPAEAATDVDRPNLAAWRAIVAAQPSEIAAVFIDSLSDDAAGEADSALRNDSAPPSRFDG